MRIPASRNLDLAVAAALLVVSVLAYFYQGGTVLARALYFHYWSRELAQLHLAVLVLTSTAFALSTTSAPRASKAALTFTYPLIGVLLVKLALGLVAIFASVDIEKAFLRPNVLTFFVAACLAYIYHRCDASRSRYSELIALGLTGLLVGVVLFAGLTDHA